MRRTDSSSSRETATQRKCEEFKFASWDGTPLAARHWPARDASSENAIILMHRGHEHSGRLQQLVDGLEMPDFHCYAYDARGHGLNPGPRGYADDFMDLVRDLEAFARFIETDHHIPQENMAVVANSVGAVVTSVWIHDFAPRVRCQVLAAPAFKVKLYVPLALPGLKALDKVRRPSFISSYVKSRMLTHDANEASLYNEDPLITRDIAVNILIGLYEHSARVVQDAQAIHTPTLILSAGRDFVVDLKTQEEFFENLGSEQKKMEVFPKFFHGVLYEKDRAKAFKSAREFMTTSFARPFAEPAVDLDLGARYTNEEYERLARPSLKNVVYGSQRMLMETVGAWLSEGVRVGTESGFDSGLSLDYIYENKARGRGPVGRLLDRTYLDAVGWKGIRERRSAMIASLTHAIEKAREAHGEARILDIAAGPGDYVLEAIRAAGNKNVRALLRDYKQANLDLGQKHARERGLRNVTFEFADAFRASSYKNISFKPNIIIVSGLFELIPDNSRLQIAVEGLASCAAPNATLFYTGQPWHPQLEMIAKTLRNRDGQPWIMRRRPQVELDGLFARAGFRKAGMKVDSNGIFTVSTAHFESTSHKGKTYEQSAS